MPEFGSREEIHEMVAEATPRCRTDPYTVPYTDPYLTLVHCDGGSTSMSCDILDSGIENGEK